MLIRMRLAIIAISLLTLGAAACSETWEGAKEDTRDNVKATGEGIEETGDSIEDQVD